jgi:hypothetical protein
MNERRVRGGEGQIGKKEGRKEITILKIYKYALLFL